jgi:hypothetical protein
VLFLHRLVSKFFPELSQELQSQLRAHFPVGAPTSTGAVANEDDCEDLGKYGAVDNVPSSAGADLQQSGVNMHANMVPSKNIPSSGQVDGGNKESEGAGDSVIPRRLWLYLVKRAGLLDPQLKWRQLNTQQLAALAGELTKGVYSVEGTRLLCWRVIYVNVAACGALLTSCDDCRERAVQGRVRDLRRRRVERGKPWCRHFHCSLLCCS